MQQARPAADPYPAATFAAARRRTPLQRRDERALPLGAPLGVGRAVLRRRHRRQFAALYVGGVAQLQPPGPRPHDRPAADGEVGLQQLDGAPWTQRAHLDVHVLQGDEPEDLEAQSRDAHARAVLVSHQRLRDQSADRSHVLLVRPPRPLHGDARPVVPCSERRVEGRHRGVGRHTGHRTRRRRGSRRGARTAGPPTTSRLEKIGVIPGSWLCLRSRAPLRIVWRCRAVLCGVKTPDRLRLAGHS